MQRQIAQSVRENSRTSVKGATGWGKTYLLASLALWWLRLHSDAIVLVTATRWKQIERQFMGEIRRAIAGSKVSMPAPQATRWELDSKRYLECISPNDEEGAGGYHSLNVLIMKDEMSGISKKRDTGLEGPMSSGNARMLEVGNPLNPTGPFVDHHKSRSAYKCFSVSAFDTPNFMPLHALVDSSGLRGDEALVYIVEEIARRGDDELKSWITHPSLTSPVWVKDRITAWGIGHPSFDSRILSRFPKYSEFALIPLAWIEDAETRMAVDDGVSDVEVGCDPAGPGKDSTAVAVRSGAHLLDLVRFTDSDSVPAVVAYLQNKWGRRIRTIRYDEIGIGYHWGIRLRKAMGSDTCRVMGINSSSTERVDTERFLNLRSALHWAMRDRLEKGDIFGFTDDRLCTQAAMIEWKPNTRGQIQIKPKDQMNASPDDWESVLYSFGCGAIGIGSYNGDLLDNEGALTGKSRFKREW